MTIAEFWNQAFIAGLTRLPADQAKKEADAALAIAIEHWRAVAKDRGALVATWAPYGDFDLSAAPQRSKDSA